MKRKTQVFISYKRGVENSLTARANAIRQFLERFSDDYDIWMDQTDLQAGLEWDKQIYQAIPISDVILVPLAKETGASKWVRREIDVARGAQVSILPVHIKDTPDEIRPVLEEFDLEKVQYISLLEGSDEEYNRLKRAIDQIRKTANDERAKWLKKLLEGEDQPILKDAHTPAEKSIEVYKLPGHLCEIHLAGGDLTQMLGIDVLVNPENNHMQMARIFERETVSSKLRLAGSYLNRSGQIVEDTVQRELYDQIKQDYPLPIAPGRVVPTHAGHPLSALVKENGIRYIFHAVTVTVQHSEKDNRVTPIGDDQIAEAVYNCLDMVVQIDRDRGRISPVGTARRDEEDGKAETYTDIESILCPLFATGQGKRQADVGQVGRIVVKAIKDYLTGDSNARNLKLKRIHVCGYSDADVQLLRTEMDQILK